MRIIAGEARGRMLTSPNTLAVRPTSDRVRESLFSILGDLKGAIVVDGFAGTGALGCEALSRGAGFCYFIERDQRAVSVVQENIRRVGGGDRSTVLYGSFEDQLEYIDHDPDLWLLDPPYHRGLAESGLAALGRSKAMSAGALVVIEQEIDEPIPDVDGFTLEDTRLYGRCRLCFFRRGST